jgi:micrococcal nuclease
MRNLFLCLFISTLPFLCFSQLSGKVISVSDGDTFTMLLPDNETVKIRLHDIDCPEKNQDFGQVAKEFLSDLIYNKSVKVQELDIDRYGRTIGIVTIGNINVNEEILKAGLAWHYKRYDSSDLWSTLEANARQEKKGLWIRKDAIAPWDYRKLKSK